MEPNLQIVPNNKPKEYDSETRLYKKNQESNYFQDWHPQSDTVRAPNQNQTKLELNIEKKENNISQFANQQDVEKT